MLSKALFVKEWKPIKLFALGLLLIYMFGYPVLITSQLDSWKQMEMHYQTSPTQLDVSMALQGGFASVISTFLIILMAAMFIGAERNTRRNDFSFALPYKRNVMFMSKWLLGVAVIVIPFSISYLIAYFMVATSEYGVLVESVSVRELYLIPLLGYLATFSFAMLIGTIAGELVSQVILTFIFIFFPLGFLFLVHGFTNVVFDFYFNQTLYFEYFVWPLYSIEPLYSGPIWVPLMATIVFTMLGQWLYEKNQIEYNGEFLVFKELEPLFKIGMVLCFSLLGGLMVSGFVSYMYSTLAIIFYWIGFFLFGILSWFMTTGLMKMKVIK
ncbi:hypothetical protein [Bacillus alkalicellulosilyticus]|uniref:hypothetical protein n=1 Tax=Alkalihalobacterium alkalicellulosilyticum TaxID=1912214 RepID=UPI000996C483|nr:hypothetical protein [Bacillus alkalicellulosilyticus]